MLIESVAIFRMGATSGSAEPPPDASRAGVTIQCSFPKENDQSELLDMMKNCDPLHALHERSDPLSAGLAP